jgi:hypothetical protein
MKRAQLVHIIRAACTIADDDELDYEIEMNSQVREILGELLRRH